jgi:hypothetical protein
MYAPIAMPVTRCVARVMGAPTAVVQESTVTIAPASGIVFFHLAPVATADAPSATVRCRCPGRGVMRACTSRACGG